MNVDELNYLRKIVGCKLPIINEENRDKLFALIDKTIPVQPDMDYWFVCPSCHIDDDFGNLAGYEPDPREGCPEGQKWVGPSFCRFCGQALNMSELNEERE